MGWYQDNFPGSPAARQRLIVSRSLVLYSIVTGAAIYLFTPGWRRRAKEAEELRDKGKLWDYYNEQRERLKSRGFFSSVPTREEFMTARVAEEHYVNRVDEHAKISEEEIRARFSKAKAAP